MKIGNSLLSSDVFMQHKKNSPTNRLIITLKVLNSTYLHRQNQSGTFGASSEIKSKQQQQKKNIIKHNENQKEFGSFHFCYILDESLHSSKCQELRAQSAAIVLL